MFGHIVGSHDCGGGVLLAPRVQKPGMQPPVHRRAPSPHHRTTQPRMSTMSRWRKPGAKTPGSRMHLLVCPSPVSGFLSLGRLTKEGSQHPRRPWGGGRQAPSFASTHSARADARTAYSGAGLRDFTLPGIKGALEKALGAEAGNWHLIIYKCRLTHLCVFYEVYLAKCPHTVGHTR